MGGSEVDTVRRLLREAGESAERMGDEPFMEPAGTGYFATGKSGGLDEAIEAIAGHEGDITMFVGAGVSAESELPSWDELVRALLTGADLGDELSDEDRELWIQATIEQGPLAAAAIARAHHPDELAFRQALRDALYDGRPPGDYLPGALATQIALLKRQLGPRLRLVTANYDGLLEAALSRAELRPVSYVRNRREPDHGAAVWHLHGRLMRNAADTEWVKVGRLVLTEGDYADSTHSKWPEEFVAQCLEESLCVFVGLSMTDPNFIRWLYRYKNTECKHLAVFVRQASAAANDAVRSSLEGSAAARWERAGVRPIWTNYFGEVAQFVHEVGLRNAKSAPIGFPDRAARCLETARTTLMPTDPRPFVEAQEDLSRWLLQQIDEVKAAAKELKVRLDNEDLGLGLWVANHAKGIAELWGTSEQVWLDPRAIEARPMHVDSRWVGVLAIMQGVAVEQDPAVYTTRWRFIRGIPIVVQKPDRCLVGSMTLTSATPLQKCPLSIARAKPELLDAIDGILSENAAGFFA
jgi:SIR2-like protein